MSTNQKSLFFQRPEAVAADFSSKKENVKADESISSRFPFCMFSFLVPESVCFAFQGICIFIFMCHFNGEVSARFQNARVSLVDPEGPGTDPCP